MVVVCQGDAVGALHVDRSIAAVGPQDLNVAYSVALAVDGEPQA